MTKLCTKATFRFQHSPFPTYIFFFSYSDDKHLTRHPWKWIIRCPFSAQNLISHDELLTALNRLLTQGGRVTHICVSKLTITCSDNGLLPGQHQAIIWTNAGILFIGSLGTNFSEIPIKIYIFSFKKMHLKMLSGKWQSHCLGLNVLSFCWFGAPCCSCDINVMVCSSFKCQSTWLASSYFNFSWNIGLNR